MVKVCQNTARLALILPYTLHFMRMLTLPDAICREFSVEMFRRLTLLLLFFIRASLQQCNEGEYVCLFTILSVTEISTI